MIKIILQSIKIIRKERYFDIIDWGERKRIYGIKKHVDNLIMNLKNITTVPLGKVVVFELDSLFEAMYAVKNPLKMYRLDTDLQKNKYDIEVEKNRVFFGKRYLELLEEKDIKKLARRHIQVIDDNTKNENLNKNFKHIYKKNKKWYAVVLKEKQKGGDVSKTMIKNKEQVQKDELEEAFVNHILKFHETDVTKIIESLENPEIVQTWINSFLSKQEENAEHIETYENEMLENAKKMYFDKYGDKYKRKKDKDPYESPHFQNWYKRNVITMKGGTVPNVNMECNDDDQNCKSQQIKNYCKRKRPVPEKKHFCDQLDKCMKKPAVAAVIPPPQENFVPPTPDRTEVCPPNTIQAMYEAMYEAMQKEEKTQAELAAPAGQAPAAPAPAAPAPEAEPAPAAPAPAAPAAPASAPAEAAPAAPAPAAPAPAPAPAEAAPAPAPAAPAPAAPTAPAQLYNLVPTKVIFNNENITVETNPTNLYKFLPLIHLFYENSKTFDIVHVNDAEPMNTAGAEGAEGAARAEGGAGVSANTDEDYYNKHRLAADLNHDFGYDLRQNETALLDNKIYKAEDKFVKYAILKALKKDPNLIYKFHLTSVDEWQNQTQTMINTVFGRNNNKMVVDGSIPTGILNKRVGQGGTSAVNNGIEKQITYGYWIDPFSPSLADINLDDTYKINTNTKTVLKKVFEEFFEPHFKDITFEFTIDQGAKNNDDKLSFKVYFTSNRNKSVEVPISPQLFSIPNIDNYFTVSRSEYYNKEVYPIFDDLIKLVDKSKQQLFLKMFKEIGDHVQLHELIQHRNLSHTTPQLANINFGSQDRILYADAIYQFSKESEKGKVPNILFPIDSFHAKFEDEHMNMILDVNYLNNEEESDSEKDKTKYIMCVSNNITRVDEVGKQQLYLENKIKALHYRYITNVTPPGTNIFSTTPETPETPESTITTFLSQAKGLKFLCNEFIKTILNQTQFTLDLPIPKICIVLDMIFAKLEEIHLFNNEDSYVKELENYRKQFETIDDKISKQQSQFMYNMKRRISRRTTSSQASPIKEAIKKEFESQLLKYTERTNKQINVLDIVEFLDIPITKNKTQNELYNHMKGFIKVKQSTESDIKRVSDNIQPFIIEIIEKLPNL